MSEKGRLHIYTGDGKGKTTAAVGLTVRYAGSGKEAMFVQFLKKSDSNELNVFQDAEGIVMMPNPWNYGFTWDMTEDEIEEIKGIYSQYLDMISFRFLQGDYGMLVLDEVLTAISEGLIKEEDLVYMLDQLPESAEVVLTGKDPSEALIERADYVSEIKKIKHPFDKGARARKGIEY